ncbi:MAG: lysylphosphatidylglycerol synthase transmembrane domain-containing protein [Candidatus Hodarchaeota archaeon]
MSRFKAIIEVNSVDVSSKTAIEEKEISLRKAFDKKTIFLLGFAFIMLLFYLLLEEVSIFDMMEVILSASPLVLLIGTSTTFIAVLLDTYTWKILLGISSIHPSTKSTYRIQLASFSYGLLIPSAGAVETIMRVSMGTKEFLNEKEGRNATSGEILSSVIAHRLCGLLSFIPISVFVAFAILTYFNDIIENEFGYRVSEEVGVSFVLIVSLISIFVILLFILIAKSPKKAKKVLLTILGGLAILPLISNWAKSVMEPSERMVDDFSIQFTYLAKNKFLSTIALTLAFVSQVTHWIAIFLILQSIHVPILIDQVAAVNFLGGTVDLIPVGIPGMAGLKEISLAFFLEKGLGLISTEATAGAILVQLVKFYFLIFIGIITYILGKTKVTAKDLEEAIN